MKKVLAWVLALALVLSSFAMSFAAYSDAEAIAADDATTAVNVLSALNVIQGYPDGSFKPDKTVTRAEMAALVIRAMGFDDNKGNLETKYSDVAKGDWYSGVIKYATDLGLVQGYADGTFKPNNTVTYFEAITMILRSLGYRDEYLIGSWPANFVNQAEELGTYNKWYEVSTENFSKGATRADCAIMIYNTLTTCMVAYDKANKGVLTYEDNYLKRLGGLELQSGTVEMDDIFNSAEGILDYTDLGAPLEYEFIVDDDVVAAIIDDDYQLVTADEFDDYTVKDDDGDAYHFENGYVKKPDENIPFAFDYAYVEIDGNYITDVWSYVSWDANETKYWTENDSKIYDQDLQITDKVVLNVQPGIKAPYNFRLDSSDNDANWYFMDGVDSMSDIEAGNIVTVYVGEENYIAWHEDEDGIIRDYKIGDKVKTGGKTYTYSIDLAETKADSESGISKIFATGNKFVLTKTEEDAEEAVYPSNDGDPIISMVTVGTETVTGTVEDFVSKEGVVVIDGTEYIAVSQAAMAEDYADNYGLAPTFNWMNYKADEFLYANLLKLKDKTVTAYLNSEGQIAYVELDSKDKLYGVYEDAEAINNGNYASGIKWGYKYSIHQDNDEDAWIALDEDMEKSDITNPGLYTYEMGLVVKPLNQLVQYQVNADGEIVKANFAAATLKTAAKFNANSGKLNGIVVDEDVVVFAKESKDANADYDVFGYEDLDGVTFAAGTEYFVEDGMIVAIKAADKTIFADKTEINIVKSVRTFSDHYVVTFIDGTEVATVDKKNIDLKVVADEYVFAFVDYNAEGEIEKMYKVTSSGANVVGTKLADGQVSDALINFGSTYENAGITYIKDAYGISRPVTDAVVYKWDGEDLTESSLDQIKKGIAIRLVRTVSEGNTWNYVIYSDNQALKFYPTEF